MMKKNAQYYIREYHDRPVSKKEFLRRRDVEVMSNHIPQKRIVDNGLLSIRKIQAYEKNGILTPLRHKGRKYFPKEEILPLLKENMQESRQTSLFKK